MPKIQQTQKELEDHLSEQLRFLETSADRFDQGDFSEAKRMAVNIRILVHDTYNKDGTPISQSLLKLLGIKDATQFLDSLLPTNGVIGSYTGLVLKSVGSKGGRYISPLDDFPPDHVFKKVSFDDYWQKDIFLDNKGNHFSRKTLVLAIANKDGGAHVAPELDADYAELTKNNSLGWIYGNDLESGPLENASFAAVRQIAHEILKTLIPNYPEKKLLNTLDSIVLGDIHLAKGFTAGMMVNAPSQIDAVPKVERNEKCPCGSGLKYKKCHGRPY